jgi:hypothetical protein
VVQTVTVTGVDDAVDDGDVAYKIVTAAATSADPKYSGMNAGDVEVVNGGNDDVPPRIMSMALQREGKKVIALSLTFSEDVRGADDVRVYRVATNSGKKPKAVPLGVPTYSSERFEVTVPLKKPISTKKLSKYSLTVFASGDAARITDAADHSIAADFERPMNQEGVIAAATDDLLISGRLRRESLITEILNSS